MSAQKPPTGQNHHRSRSRKPVDRGLKPPEDLKSPPPSIPQDLRRNADLIKRKVVQKQVDNATAKQPKQVLQDLLNSIKNEAQHNMASREVLAGYRHKRHAPPPPIKGDFLGACTSSTPDLASAPPSPKEAPRRGKLRKSLSLSGSRMLFHSFLNTIRITSKRRSRSQDSIFDLGYLDQDQQVVRNAAVKAQHRRGSVQPKAHMRSLSAEPRSQLSAAVERDPIPNRGSPSTAKRPDKLFLSSPLSSKKRFRERSPLVKTPVFIPEVSLDQTDGPRRAKGIVRLKAKLEIDLFEKLISNHIQNNLQTTNL